MILLSNISKLYRKHLLGNHAIHALNDVTLSIPSGESIALMGPNGSGKSTLLRIILGITKPDSGLVQVSGSQAALIELMAGFNWELSGRENIYFNGVLQGMTRQEVKDKYDSIIDFAEIKNFQDVPTKHYSTGMLARLSLSITIHINADIFLIDEVLAVGDYNFQQKCIAKMKYLSSQGKTIVFVTHDKNLAGDICSRVVYMESGRITGQ